LDGRRGLVKDKALAMTYEPRYKDLVSAS